MGVYADTWGQLVKKFYIFSIFFNTLVIKKHGIFLLTFWPVFGPLFMLTKIPWKLMMSWRRNVSLQQNGIVFCLLLSPLLFIILQSSNPASEMTLCHLNCQLHKASPEEWVAETNKKTLQKQQQKNCVVCLCTTHTLQIMCSNNSVSAYQ